MEIKEFENKVIQGDCLEVMQNIPDNSIDMILCDLPYGTTQNKWDSVISFDKLWEQYKRIVKENGAVLLHKVKKVDYIQICTDRIQETLKRKEIEESTWKK